MTTAMNHSFSAEEAPTVRRANVPEPTLNKLYAIRRLAQVAVERLTVSPDADTIIAALGDLASIVDLAEDAAV